MLPTNFREQILQSDASCHIAFSSCAAIAARLIAHPLDTIKTRIQYNSATTNSPWQSLFRTESVRALYRGLPVALLFSVPALSVYLGTYDHAKVVLSRWGVLGNSEAIPVHVVASSLAEILSASLWTPMEVLKNRLQVRQKSSASLAEGGQTRRIVQSIYQAEGIRGFFKGYWLALAVFVPYTVTYFVTYEQLKRQAGKMLGRHSKSTIGSTQAEHLPLATYLVCSASAGALAGAVSNATDIVKTRVQAGKGRQGAMSVISQMWKNEGKWRAFGRGLGARVLWVAPTVTISMSVYEILKDWRIEQLQKLGIEET
ncbi:mitochondrial carrier domain-containing protein [Phlyctochytrium arcticum]|nr:mitochondrial carrier domain-containing protein [Phlyctochytrium arcticum]